MKILRDQTSERASLEQLAANRKELVQALDDNLRARRQLEAADLAKDRFLAILSHELRNPLAAISGSTELLASRPDLDRGSRERAQSILGNQIEAMKRLLDDLLDISRLRFGRLALKKQVTLLSLVVEQALDMARPMLARRRHELTTRMPDFPVMLCVDPVRMSQVLCNLLVNAAKYTDEGGHVALSARIELDQCVIDVTDDGRGLDEDALASMFEMFWRSSEFDAAGAHSMGIGLALVRSVVSLHEGSVGATSPGPGQGSTFTIRLPLYLPAGEEPRAPARQEEAAGPDGNGAVAKPQRIVVADDHEDVAWTLATVLEGAGHEVRTATQGAQVIVLAQDFQPDVVVLDIGMPGMSGYEVAERLRAMPRGTDMILVAATGWGSESDRQASASAGFDAHLIKPVSAAELAGAIEGVRSARE